MHGVSLVICCHNGAKRLPTTLAHLTAQNPPGTPWEVLLVDNGSTDDTADVARACWQDGPAPLRIIDEPCVGVRHARARGLGEAKYPLVGFVDDDNWLHHDWLRVANEVMLSDSNLGAVGSIRTPACEVPPPAWFVDVHSLYAVLTDRELEQIERPVEYLLTAGLCVRKAAWENLLKNGFRHQLDGKTGRLLQGGGEDVELTRALLLSGWTLRTDARLRLRHFIPSHRLQWMYVRRLQRNYSASDVLLDAYSQYSLSLKPGLRRWLSDCWWYQCGKSLSNLAWRPAAVAVWLASSGEGRLEILDIERQVGRALGLLHHGSQYGELRRDVRDAVWRSTADCREVRCESSSEDNIRTGEVAHLRENAVPTGKNAVEHPG
jgi:glycosyltransferase involved in cell wall biosynthesis